MSEKHIGKVIQVIGPVLDIQFKDGELPDLLNAIEIDNHGQKPVSYTHLRDDIKRTLLVVIAGDRGLAGGYNANVFKQADAAEGPVTVLPIGKRSAEYFACLLYTSG